jgi:sterol desaturase/sphingolipid hydroxylase (fatty acid hydroxylase superfamily)
MTRFWDRLMGTEVASYEQSFVVRSVSGSGGAESRPAESGRA